MLAKCSTLEPHPSPSVLAFSLLDPGHEQGKKARKAPAGPIIFPVQAWDLGLLFSLPDLLFAFYKILRVLDTLFF